MIQSIFVRPFFFHISIYYLVYNFCLQYIGQGDSETLSGFSSKNDAKTFVEILFQYNGNCTVTKPVETLLNLARKSQCSTC